MPTYPTQRDSSAWLFFVKVSWAASVLALTLGILYLPAPIWVKGFIAMGALFLTGSSFTLAKTLRDEFEAKRTLERFTDS